MDLDITSNAQALDGNQPERDQLVTSTEPVLAANPTDKEAEAEADADAPLFIQESDAILHQVGGGEAKDPENRSQSSAETAVPPADPPQLNQLGQSARLNDLTSPPPNYDVGKYRMHFWQYWRPKDPPHPPPYSLDDAKTIPLTSVNFFNEILYIWINPLMRLGYQRPLQGTLLILLPLRANSQADRHFFISATDLWKMDEKHTAAVLAKRFQLNYDKRQAAAREYNKRLDAGEIEPALFTKIKWRLSRGDIEEKQRKWKRNKRRHASLFWTMSHVVGLFFWLGGFSKIIGDTAQLMGPLVSRDLIQFAQEKAANRAAGRPLPNIGRGVGDAIGLLLLTCASSIFQHFFFYRFVIMGIASILLKRSDV